MKARKAPTRSCIACRKDKDKRELVRFVRSPEGRVSLDTTGRAAGRGAYLCANQDCFELAAKAQRLSTGLKIRLNQDDYDRLRREFSELVHESHNEESDR